MNRRHFIRTTMTAVVAGYGLSGVSFSSLASSSASHKRIGLQLYSIKDDLEKDFSGSMTKLQKIGYHSVETYGFDGTTFFGKKLSEFNRMLGDMGMMLSGTHTGSPVLPADTQAKEWDLWKNVCAELKAAHATRAIQSWLPPTQTMDELKRLAEHYNRVGEVCKKEGIRFGIHNHSAEFKKVDGVMIYDYLLEHTQPDLVFFQLDMGHALEAGADCVEYVKKYPGRFTSWHLTDHKPGVGDVELGLGDVDYDQLFTMTDMAKLDDLVVEQETGEDRFAACQRNFDFVVKRCK
ncbi:MAG: sugar phosphate isomerase/epimerase [Tannerellaceae bacterium]|nr:sugar phosphate isomerase/epimerase [Tannerellaceae bacterium]